MGASGRGRCLVWIAVGLFTALLCDVAASLAAEPPQVFERVEEYRLENGMLFLLLPRTDVPTVSGRILFRVGNVDNPIGQTGLAHMFEHMAFKGTDRIGTRDWEAEQAVQDSVAIMGAALASEMGRREFADSTRIATLRADLEELTDRQMELTVPMEWPRMYDGYTFGFNAYTTDDFTVYHADLPANNITVWMLMESERLQHPVFREFYRERDVVLEERREHTEDDPAAGAYELLESLSFTAHPYRFPTIGYHSDIELLTMEQAAAFWRAYYVPGNAIGALVGDFDLESTKRLLKDYFGDIPPGPPPPEVTTREPAQHGERRGLLRQGIERQLSMAFPGFHPTDRNRLITELLAQVLSRDETSRLDRRLDFEEHAVRSISASSSGGFQRYPGLFVIDATPLEDVTNAQVEGLIWEELERLVSEPISQVKLDEIRASLRKRYYYSLETNHSLCAQLVSYQATHGSWRRSYERFDLLDSVTVDELTILARELFRRDQVTVVYLEPEDEDLLIIEEAGS